MRPRIPRYLPLVVLLFCRSPLEGQWQWIGPEGGRFPGFVQHPTNPNVLYAAGEVYPSPLFKSTDHGATWTRLGVTNTYPYGMAIVPTSPVTLYVNGGSRIYKTTNEGVSWSYSTLPSNHYAQDFLLQPGDPSVVHCAGYFWDNVLSTPRCFHAKSTNGGTSWSVKTLTTDYGWGYAVCLDPTNPQTVYVGGMALVGTSYPGKVFKSTNGGTDFVDATGMISGYVYDLAHDPGAAGRLYAATGSGVYRTTDGGGSWTRHSGTLTAPECVEVCGTNPSILYVGTSLGKAYKSTNGGVNWTLVDNGIQGNYTQGLIVENSTTVFIATSSGVFGTTNGGTSWSARNTGLSSTQITSVRHAPSQPSVVYAGVSGDAVYKTTGAGQATVTWSRIPDFYSCTEVADMVISAISPDVLYALEGGT